MPFSSRDKPTILMSINTWLVNYRTAIKWDTSHSAKSKVDSYGKTFKSCNWRTENSKIMHTITNLLLIFEEIYKMLRMVISGEWDFLGGWNYNRLPFPTFSMSTFAIFTIYALFWKQGTKIAVSWISTDPIHFLEHGMGSFMFQLSLAYRFLSLANWLISTRMANTYGPLHCILCIYYLVSNQSLLHTFYVPDILFFPRDTREDSYNSSLLETNNPLGWWRRETGDFNLMWWVLCWRSQTVQGENLAVLT